MNEVIHPTRPGDVVRPIGGSSIGIITEVNSPRGRLAGMCGVMWVGGRYPVNAKLEALEIAIVEGINR